MKTIINCILSIREIFFFKIPCHAFAKIIDLSNKPAADLINFSENIHQHTLITYLGSTQQYNTVNKNTYILNFHDFFLSD